MIKHLLFISLGTIFVLSGASKAVNVAAFADVAKRSIRLLILPILLSSCGLAEDAPQSICTVGTSTGRSCERIEVWNVVGPVSAEYDSMNFQKLLATPDSLLQIQREDTVGLWHSGIYCPLYNQLDLREVYNIAPEDTSHILADKIVYLHCKLNASAETEAYIEAKYRMDSRLFLNGDTLHRVDIQGLNFYPVHLVKGTNHLLVKVNGTGEDLSFEAQVLDSISMAGQTVCRRAKQQYSFCAYRHDDRARHVDQCPSERPAPARDRCHVRCARKRSVPLLIAEGLVHLYHPET